MTSEKRDSEDATPASLEDGLKKKAEYGFLSEVRETSGTGFDNGHAQGLLGNQGQSEPQDHSLAASIIWMMVNNLATVGIVGQFHRHKLDSPD